MLCFGFVFVFVLFLFLFCFVFWGEGDFEDFFAYCCLKTIYTYVSLDTHDGSVLLPIRYTNIVPFEK